ncbi:MAG: glycogen synthase GlgA [Pseudomonadota bacterium]
MTEESLRVLFVTPELAPWVKSGGLGDVAHALPHALRRIGIDVRVLTPAYPALLRAFPDARPAADLELGAALGSATVLETVTADGLPLLLLHSPRFYQRGGNAYQDERGTDWGDNHLRFGALSRAAALLAAAPGRDPETSPQGSTTLPSLAWGGGAGGEGRPWRPRVVHCNDWPCGLAPAYLRYAGQAPAASVMTVHNLAFQGNFPPATLGGLGLPSQAFAIDGVEFYGQVSFLKAGLQLADRITTVSPTYAEEIQSAEHGCGLDGLLRYRRDRLTGILNGIDTERWNPATDPFLARRYDAASLEHKADNKRALQLRMGLPPDGSLPLLGCVARITHQKGLDLLPEIAAELAALPVQLALLGQGEPALEARLLQMAHDYPQRFAVMLGYDEPLAHLIEGGADAFLMPSRFEPCGLNQMYSLRYGTPPVVRATGGLADTVADCNPLTLAAGSANGFTFREPTSAALLAAVRRAVDAWHQPALWRRLQENGMARDFGWTDAARRYRAVYVQATTKAAAA